MLQRLIHSDVCLFGHLRSYCRSAAPCQARLQNTCRSRSLQPLSSRRNTQSAASVASDKEETDGSTLPDTSPLEDIQKIDLRTGRILGVRPHPDADDLYVEEIDVGEIDPRVIVSGLRKYVDAESLEGKMVVVVCNLKPRKMRGVSSTGMLLCASNEDHSVVEPVRAPDGPPGERVHFGQQLQADPATPNQVQKKKLWEACLPELKTNSDGVACFRDYEMSSSHGTITSSLKHANLS